MADYEQDLPRHEKRWTMILLELEQTFEIAE